MIKVELPYNDVSEDKKNELIRSYQLYFNSSSEKWIQDIYSFLINWTNDSDVIQLKTSGSTGNPKEIVVRKETMLFSAAQSVAYFDFKKFERWLLCLPAEFIGGQMLLVRALLSHAEVWAVEPKIKLDVKDEFDFASMIPLQANDYFDQKRGLIKKILIGGAALPSGIERKLSSGKETEYFASYGMTETVSHIALRKINGEGSSAFFSPLKNILLGKDERGCLTIYNRNYSVDVIITNDLAEFNEFNQFVITGRFDNIINSGGLKIIPEVLEKIISEIITHPILIIGLPDEQSGEKIVLVIESSPYDERTLSMLQKSIEDKLPKAKRPKMIDFMNSFSETKSGKIDRIKTKELYLKNLRTSL